MSTGGGSIFMLFKRSPGPTSRHLIFRQSLLSLYLWGFPDPCASFDGCYQVDCAPRCGSVESQGADSSPRQFEVALPITMNIADIWL
jgi:hypothetical protein